MKMFLSYWVLVMWVAGYGQASGQATGVMEPEMIYVERGSFMMGSDHMPAACYWCAGEAPRHKVTLSGFYIGKNVVTQREWMTVMGSNPSYFSNCDDCPVTNVSFGMVQEYIAKLNRKTGKRYRLPTEAEWEYAARGGSPALLEASGERADFAFSGSDNVNEVAWHLGNSKRMPHKAGIKKPNQLGLYDMSGNVSQWCADWYHVDFYSHSPLKNPVDTMPGKYRVCRGGHFMDGYLWCRCDCRDFEPPDSQYPFYGFRLALSAEDVFW